MQEWANRVMTLVWSSSLSLMLDGFATHAIGSYPTTPHDPPQNAISAGRASGRDIKTTMRATQGGQHE